MSTQAPDMALNPNPQNAARFAVQLALRYAFQHMEICA